MKSIEITDVQAIEHCSIPIPDDGGVIVLRGSQGCGKSTALQAVQVLGGKKVDTLAIRDGAKRGTIEFDGVKVVITKSRTAKSGELAFEMIESRFDIGKIVDPQILDPDRADAARIKQLLALTGAKPDPDAYWRLLREYVDACDVEESEIDDDTDDPIELHKRFVTAMQAIARRLERASDQMRVDPAGIRKRFEGLNIRNPPVVDDIRHVYDECLRADHEVKERQKIAERQRNRIEEARIVLERKQSSYKGPTLEEAEKNYNALTDAAKRAHQAMLDATTKYNRLRDEAIVAENELRVAAVHFQAIADSKEIIDQTTIAAPLPEEIAESQAAVEKAAKLLDDAVRANEGASLLKEAEQSNFEADRKATQAAEIRNACRKAEDILAACVKLEHIRVEGNRLVVSTDRSESEPFAELSHGERAILAIREAARYVPKQALCSVSQEVWGGISEHNKNLINAEAKQLRIGVLTAEVTDDEELTAEVME
ncbi:MAG: hypothetical protein E6Q97_08075 [Desulfurellales bacterium]|nr:MAG: hypothetical protein E6Q97_08075 [Desulfurellales bacterium]